MTKVEGPKSPQSRKGFLTGSFVGSNFNMKNMINMISGLQPHTFTFPLQTTLLPRAILKNLENKEMLQLMLTRAGEFSKKL